MKLETHARHAQRLTKDLAKKSLALFLCFYMFTGCNGDLAELTQPQSPEAQAGLRDYQRPLLIEVPGGLANAAGGNLLVLPGGLSIETTLGVEDVAPVYNSTTGQWRFGGVQMTYDGVLFTDQTGAEHDVTAVADGAAIPGSVWIKVDADTIMAKGGLVFEFGAEGALAAKHRLGQQCPRILYEDVVGGPVARIEIRQQDCSLRGEWTAFNTDLYTLDLNSQGWIERVSDRAGRLALYTYDESGNLVAARDGLDVEKGWPGFRYEYSAIDGRLSSATNSEDERIEYEYYSPTLMGTPRLQLATRVAQAGEGNLQYRFDYYAGSAEGISETIVTDPMGDSRRFFFDDSRRVQEIAFESVAESEFFGYVGAGLRPTSHTLANGATESYTRDANGDILTVTQPSGNVVVHTYTDANSPFPYSRAMASKEDDIGALGAWTYTEDSPVDYARLETAANGMGEVTRYAWYPNGGYTRLASVTYPNGVVREYAEYNSLGQATQIFHGDLVGRVAFDEVGNRTAGNNGTGPEIGGVIARRFDADRRPFEVTVTATDGLNSVIHMSRGSDGRILSIDRPPLGLGTGADHRFTYNTLGQPVEREERVDGVWQSTFFEYDGRGQRTVESLPNGMRREWAYDQRGRPTERRAYRDGALEGEVYFHYANGNLVSVDDSRRGWETYSYDAAGRPTTIRYDGGETLDFQFDLRSRIVKETYRGPDATVMKEIEREYDLADRETRLYDNGQLVIDRTRSNGQIECIETGNGLKRCFTYESVFGLRDSALTTNDDLEVLESTNLTHSLSGIPTNWEARSTTSIPGLGEVETTFRVGPATAPSIPGSEAGKRVLAWDNGAGSSESYAYDGLSNQVDDADGDLYDYNTEGNRLLAATVGGVSVAYTYDAAGFADTRDGVPIEWTASGRMASYGAFAIEWDMQGRPLRAADSSSAPAAIRDWSRWGGRIEMDGDEFLVALDLGEVVLGFGPTRRYRHFDFRGNVSFVSDENGEVVSLYGYSPYQVDAVIGDESDPVRFVGRSEIGPFLWLGERMYDPLVGRFLSPDPVFSLLNQYTYTLGNPVWFSDPTGRFGVPRTMSEFMDVVAIAVAVAGLALAVGSLVVVSAQASFVLGVLGILVATVSLVITVSNIGPPDPGGPGSGCGCTPGVIFGPGDAGNAGELPSGAAPTGSPGSDSSGGEVGSVGGIGGNSIGGIGGGFGGASSCGLTGIEFLFFVGFALARTRRRRAR